VSIVDRLFGWAQRVRRERLLHRHGGIQQCPWCRQIAQDEPGWRFDAWDRDPMLDVLTCGVCGGTSLWLWGMGMHWIGALRPPAPAWPDDAAMAQFQEEAIASAVK
jgi:hypothetical protein